MRYAFREQRRAQADRNINAQLRAALVTISDTRLRIAKQQR
jgi:hypothetical protein